MAAVVPEVFTNGKILCIGMGGGCDIITAYVTSQHLPGLSKDIHWGNTKRNPQEAVQLTPKGHIHRVTAHRPLEKGKNYYGTCGIDAAVPQGELSPLLVRIPRVEKGAKADENVLREIASELRTLGFDAVVGVDAGGDSLTGGIDHAGDPSTGVDQMMGRVLMYSGLPYMQVVCGLGSDGESTQEQILKCIEAERQSGAFIGEIPMKGWAPAYRQLSGVLEDYRTPNIMAKAIELVEQGVDPMTEFLVERGDKPKIPILWLSQAYLFLRRETLLAASDLHSIPSQL